MAGRTTARTVLVSRHREDGGPEPLRVEEDRIGSDYEGLVKGSRGGR